MLYRVTLRRRLTSGSLLLQTSQTVIASHVVNTSIRRSSGAAHVDRQATTQLTISRVDVYNAELQALSTLLIIGYLVIRSQTVSHEASSFEKAMSQKRTSQVQ